MRFGFTWLSVTASILAAAGFCTAAWTDDQPSSAASSTNAKAWEQDSENCWHHEGVFRFAYGENGAPTGLLMGRSLYELAPDGSPREAKNLPAEYFYVGIRSDYLIGIAAKPTRADFLDRKTGALKSTIPLPDGEPTGFALHPQAPAAYICIKRPVGPFNSACYILD